jgi:hypothetical protein
MTELGEAALADWATRIERSLRRITSIHEPGQSFLAQPDWRMSEVTAPDWGGFPIRVARCLSRRRALEVLDWQSERGDEGRRRLQEEYLEWRVIRDEQGRIRRVEMTTELPEYWRTLAAWEPGLTLELVAELAREPSVPIEAVYGDLDPHAAGVSPDDRERAFASAMLGRDGGSPYNNGQKAICCMVHPTNTLAALVELVARSAKPYAVEDASGGRYRHATAAEVIPMLGGAAQAGRNSDPVLVERLGRLAFEGRLVALADPVGVYVQAVEHSRLRQPDGSDVPPEWFSFERSAETRSFPGEPPRYQRLVFEVPPSEALSVGDLVDVTTEQALSYGGQIADLVQLAVLMRTSAPGILAAEPQELTGSEGPPDRGCEGVRGVHREFLHSHGGEAKPDPS